MTDLVIRIRENNRRIVRGFTFDDRLGRYQAQVFEGETIKPQINLSDWLGSATISTAAITAEGGTVTQSNSDGIVTLTVSGVGTSCDAKLTITASDGRVRVEKFRFLEASAVQGRNDYYSYVGP